MSHPVEKLFPFFKRPEPAAVGMRVRPGGMIEESSNRHARNLLAIDTGQVEHFGRRHAVAVDEEADAEFMFQEGIDSMAGTGPGVADETQRGLFADRNGAEASTFLAQRFCVKASARLPHEFAKSRVFRRTNDDSGTLLETRKFRSGRIAAHNGLQRPLE